MSDEITITLTSLSTNTTESISISQSSTKLIELCEFAVALLNLPSSSNLILSRDGKRLYVNDSTTSMKNQPVSYVGIQNGDLIVVISPSSNASSSSSASTARAPAVPAASGGLDFSALLGGTATPAAAAAAPAPAASSSGGLTFNLPSPSMPLFNQQSPVQWDNMTLDDCVQRNPNPEHFIRVLLNESRHPNLWKELNYHSPILATKLKTAYGNGSSSGITRAANIWRDQMQKNTMSATLSLTMKKQREAEMQRRLQSNPTDSEALSYFDKKIKQQNVDAQYRQMMNEFPESMGRVLMLYIDTEVNGHPIQAFVDSGAQSTIMSSKCAKECGLLDLIDTRFEGTAVGVGTGKILGRVHMADMKVNQHLFSCSITIMDSEKGLGDKNMEFLLGLDMLKRYRCNIDLGRNMLVFRVGDGTMETPFLHEKDLAENKGGTKGFDAEKNNRELEKMMVEDDEKGKDENGGGKEKK